jgi:hypothetical protein
MAHGDLGHFEIPADDIERAKRFYAELFGWEFKAEDAMPDYHGFTTPSLEVRAGGAIGKRGEGLGDQPRQYISVDNVEETLRRVPELGGIVIQERAEVPDMGYWAVITDTEGNELGIWEDISKDD